MGQHRREGHILTSAASKGGGGASAVVFGDEVQAAATSDAVTSTAARIRDVRIFTPLYYV